MSTTIIAVLVIVVVLIAGGVLYKKKKSSTSKVTNNAPKVILSQDHWDSDNYSMIEIAGRLHSAGIINLIAVDISGRDQQGKSGILFKALLPKEVPVFLNHHGDTRVTPTGSRYPKIQKYTSDTIPDSQRPDIDALAALIQKSSGDITYISGGHLDNLERLVTNHNSTIQQKFKKVVVSSGWSSTSSGKPEMNLSQGVRKATATSRSTQIVFDKLPKNIKLVIATDPKSKLLGKTVSLNEVQTPALRYLVEHGTYYKGDNKFKPGDFSALMYGVYGLNFGDAVMFKEVNTCFNVNGYGAVTIRSGDCNQSYVRNLESDAWFVELFKQHLKV